MNRKQALVLVPILVLTAGATAAAFRSHGHPLRVELETVLPSAANAGLQDATGVGFLQDDQGHLRIVVDLHGAHLPPGTVLEGWVVDAGLQGGPGTTSVSDDDELYGIPFQNATFDEYVDNAPYALSTGMLHQTGNWYTVNFRIDNNLSPYDAVVVTLESDGNGDDYDPRPGSMVVAGPILR